VTDTDGLTFKVEYQKVAPFPRAKFLQFLSRLKIQSKDLGLVPFRMLGSQVYVLDEVCKALDEGVTTFVILKARQLGMTSFWIAVDLFWAFEHKGLLGTFILHKEEARDDWRTAIEVFYHEIPSTVVVGGAKVKFRVPKTAHNRNVLSFANGSRFRYLIAGTAENRKGGLGRSGASNFVHGTEVAFYGNEEDIAAFKSSTSSRYAHRMQVWESTANGFNHFYDTWESAKTSKTMRAIFVGWWRDERNQFSQDDPRFKHFIDGRSLTKDERTRIRLVKELYAYTIAQSQLAWYRWKFEDEFNNDQATMDQEYPWTEDDAFQATGSQFFTTQFLTAATKFARKQPYQGFRYKMTSRWEETEVHGFADPRAELRVWEHASKFGYYAIGCDPSYGSSDEADRNVISVWRCYADGFVQVAEFCSPVFSTYRTAWALAHLAGFYGANESRVLLELNGPGKAVFTELQTVQQHLREMKPGDDNFHIRNVLKNVRDFYYKRVDSMQSNLVYHWTTTADLKRGIMNRFKDACELNRLTIRSIPLLEEMRRIVNDAGHIAAEGAHHDDRVMGAALAYEAYRAWMWQRLRNMNMTMAHNEKVERQGGELPLDRHLMNYLRQQGIALHDS
jgi:hypothetical protein